MDNFTKNVNSSVVKTISFDTNGDLSVEFNSGKRTTYVGVDASTAENFANASSVGNYLNSVIKPRFSTR